jgi:hypothetical protein
MSIQFDDPILEAVVDEVLEERYRQIGLKHGGDTDEFDRGNSQNDWIAYIATYTGRAADKVFSNDKSDFRFRDNMVKAAALCIAAIQASENGYC